jgi:hypothetical protein
MVLAWEMLGVVMPFCFESVHGMLSLISTIFCTPVDVTLQELAVEFFPRPMISRRGYCVRWRSTILRVEIMH